MTCRAALRITIAASSQLVRALVLASVVNCGNSDHPIQAPSEAQGEAGSSGDGGSPDTSAGHSEVAGAGAVPATGGEAGTGGTGGTGDAPATGGGAGAPSSEALCFSNSDCDDGLYCNGIELCKSASPGSDAKVCMGPEHGPCGPSACDEATKTCDCSNPDQDHDGFKIGPCTARGPYDCDDTDSNRYPGNPEVCDHHDEDCDENTYGSKDDDHDGFFDQHCSNKLVYQPLFSTSEQPLTASGTDCADDNEFVHPGAVEVCDGLDNNCNGEIDEVSGGQGDPHTFYKDQDGDYWGSDENPLDTLCNFPPAGYSVLHGDCNDHDPRVSPGREEICNGIDDDCNGTVDQPGKPGELMFGQPYDGITEFECAGAQGWKVKTCPPGRLDCGEQSYLDACETVGTTLCNCHACGKTCAFSCGDTDCEEISSVSMGDTHTCAIVAPATGATPSGGKVACWGRNALGQLGDGTTKNSAIPILVTDMVGVSAIALGERHTCAIAAGPRALCWGNNEFGQLGAASTQLQSIYPLQVRSPAEWGNPTMLAAGTNHSCAIYGQGLLACWGFNETGQLGNDDEGPQRFTDAPVQVVREVGGELSFVRDAAQVVGGELHSCALTTGKVECWGDNELGQLGENPETLTTRPVARPVPGLEGLMVDTLAAAAFHTCARSGTDVYCWGDNSYGELANDDLSLTSVTKIPLPPNIVTIAVGRFFGCAVSSDGTARCWGSNEYGQRATAQENLTVAPTLIPLSNIARMFGGDGGQACARTNDAKTWCWGKNTFGQLGNGTNSDDPQPTPKPVSPPNNGMSCGGLD